MTKLDHVNKKLQIYAAWNAGFITIDKCNELIQKAEREYYLETYGEFELADIAGVSA